MNIFLRKKAQPKSAGIIFHAHLWKSQSGGMRVDDRAPDGDSAAADKGAWAGYGPVDFGGGTSDQFMAFTAAGKTGGRIEIRIDSPGGDCIGALSVPAADTFGEQYAAVSTVRGTHELFLVFPEGGIGLDWFVFSADPGRETPPQRAERMRWWREARFGQFVHWGAYSVLGRGEWVMYREDWPRGKYEREAAVKLNPSKFHAGRWIGELRGAGQKYLIVTAKHHDGFSMFDTRTRGFDPAGEEPGFGRYDIVEFARGRRDVMAELSRECRRRGIRFGVYYSILDWHHASQRPRAGGSGLTDIVPGMKDRYVSGMKEQLRELLERYDPDLLWFDGDWGDEQWWWTEADGRALYRYVRSLKPSIIVNERVRRGRGLGDFLTPEQEIPARSLPGDWESCLTMNDNWGYHAQDQRWKSGRELIRLLAETASKGGNLLLNVGPQPDGAVPWMSRELLREIGGWMLTYGESIRGTTAGPFAQDPAWGCCTARAGRLYAHVFDWPRGRVLRLPALRNVIGGACALGRPGSPLAFRRAGDEIEIDLPARPPDNRDTVIVLELDGVPEAIPGH